MLRARPTLIGLLCAVTCLGLYPSSGLAQSVDPPPSLDPTHHDLIRLNSGEWLQGDIENIRDGKVYFDSKELDDLQIDLDDISAIRADRRHTYRFEGRRDILTGSAKFVGGEIIIDTGSGLQTRKRSALLTMISGEPKELNYWSGMGSLGYSMRNGNTDQSDLSILLKLDRGTALTRLQTSYNAAFSTQSGASTANSHRGNGNFDLFVTNRFYVIVTAFEVFADEFQNIALRLTPNVGLGYDVIQHKRVSWTINGGAGYQYTSLGSALVGSDTSSSDAALIAATTLEVDPTSRVEWDTTYQIQVIPTTIGQTNHHLTSILSVELLGPLDLDATFNWDRLEDPRTDSKGKTPVKNDYRLSVGLGFDF